MMCFIRFLITHNSRSAGRVARKAEGKTLGTIIDFRDDFGMYNGWLNKRKTYYKRKKYTVSEIDYDHYDQ